MNSTAILFGVFAILLLMNMPVAMALGFSAITAAFFLDIPLALLPQVYFTSLDSFPILAVPFFILAGALMNETGMCERILDFANSLVGHVRGGLAMVCIVGAMIFASISGAGTAATAAIGSILIAIGVIIPPSIPMIIFGAVMSLSVGKLFLGGVLPGILAGIALMITVHISSVRRRYPVEKHFSIKRVKDTFIKALPALGMPVIILGGIFFGVFTPTEAAIVAVVYTILASFITRKVVKPRQIPEILTNVAVMTSIATFLVASASLFAWILASERIPQQIAEFLLLTLHNKYLILAMINILLLFVGTFLENISAIIILAPVLMPIGQKIGMDPYHMAVMICFNLAVGMATPPVGANLFIAGAISRTNLASTSRAAIPYLIAMMIVLMIVTYIPAVSLWLPTLLGK
jgi:C4-dicarboxylate transporter DctM subunit